LRLPRIRPTLVQPELEPLSLWRQHWRAVMLQLPEQAGMQLAAVWPVRFRLTRLLQRRRPVLQRTPMLQARRLLQRRPLLRLRRLL